MAENKTSGRETKGEKVERKFRREEVERSNETPFKFLLVNFYRHCEFHWITLYVTRSIIRRKLLEDRHLHAIRHSGDYFVKYSTGRSSLWRPSFLTRFRVS